MATIFHAGQRWVSETEPELGLGLVLRVGARTVTVGFGATGEQREYALEGGPLVRARFHAGERLATLEGLTLTVEAVAERQGLLFYEGAGQQVCETALSHTLQFNAPRQRLLAGQFDAPEAFRLRLAALGHQHRQRQAETRGFLGGRIDLLPHQLAIAAEVTRRLAPRVLLADEAGLGKTIEAGLILHRLHLTGRVRRALVVVPEPLLHQWFLELMRRFNLRFHLYDEDRCQALEAQTKEANPFLDDQLVLCAPGLFTAEAQGARRLDQAVAAGWDLLIVDEAHHLTWSPQGESPAYAAVARLAAESPGLLLLTATPEQLGVEGHFARLRLLDPARFHDLQAYLDQARALRAVATLAERMLEEAPLAPEESVALARLMGQEPEALEAERAGSGRQALLARLVDQHGTGRVFFRNTRARIPGFPQRVPRLAPLSCGEDPSLLRALAREFAADAQDGDGGRQAALAQDPRLLWLVQLLHATGPAKILLICRTRAKAEAIAAALAQHLKVKAALFHEGLTLVQRDRGAAWFAETDGARLLICSELGSEGRNFQFAHDLVLFDLPLDPDLLEQRIGRLDRIGQASAIQVHVPYVTGSPQEVLALWYHEGLDAFARNRSGGAELMAQFQARIQGQHGPVSEEALAELLEDTRQASEVLAARLETGRDRLLELNALGPAGAAGAERLVDAIQAQDEDRGLDRFLLACFDHWFLPVEEVAPRTYQLGSAGMLADAFPGLTSDGLTFTTDRQRALIREDLQWLTWDHPLVTGALELLLGSQDGNCCCERWPDPQGAGLYLEAIFLLECMAPAALQVDRFLPPTPVRVVVDVRGRDVGQTLTPAALARQLRGQAGQLRGLAGQIRPEWRSDLLPPMLAQVEALAVRQVGGMVARARQAMALHLGQEQARLEDLRRAGGAGDGEALALAAQRRHLDQHLVQAGLRLEALRLIHRG